MIKIGDNYYRNLEEQVQKNKEDIAAHYNIDRVLADFGIRIIGQVTSASYLPDPSTFTGDYGDAYAVGTTPPYYFFVWTRADVDSGHPSDYWFNIGRLAIVGPQGPEGPEGPKGNTGERGSKWSAGNTMPNITSNVLEGDMWMSPLGDIYRAQTVSYGTLGWVRKFSIRGPQGIQGIQGPQGEQGEQGPQGIPGQRGDVGGFINISGILTNENQLPDPTDVGNLTVAYLVGTEEPYDLYVQIGETSATATWNNVGPLNVATLVTVGGEFQNTWDADTKLDKLTYISSDPIAYIKNTDGTQGTLAVTTAPVSGGIVQRYNSGQIHVPETPTSDVHATSKKYVDDLPSNSKTESGAEYFKVYAKDDLSDQASKIFTPGSFKMASSDWGYTTDWTPSQMIHSITQADGTSLTKTFEFPTNSGTLATTNDIETEITSALADVKDIKFLRQEIPAGGAVTLLPNSLYMISVSGNNVCLRDSSDLTAKGQFLIVFCADIGTAGPNKFAVMGMVYGGGLSIDTFTVVATRGVTKLKNYNTSSTAGYNVLVKQ